MGIGWSCGALLEAIVATGSWVSPPISGSRITVLELKAYLGIQWHSPSRSPTYEAAADSTTNAIDKLVASMVVAHNIRVHKPHTTDCVVVSTVRHSGIGRGGDTYNSGLSIPFRYHVYAARAPANCRHYKHQTFQPVELAQSKCPHVYPEHIDDIPLDVFRAYERLPVQRTAELSRHAPPPSKDGNPHDIDTAAKARIRNEIINVHVLDLYSKAKSIIEDRHHNLNSSGKRIKT